MPTQPFPNNQDPISDSDGLIQQAWYYLLLWFYQKTGGSGATIPAEVVTVGASPFTYDAVRNGSVVISVGTVSLIQIVRGTDTLGTGMTAGVIPVLAGDSIIVTHTGAPSMHFLPSEALPSELT